jgi:hypothetical protein
MQNRGWNELNLEAKVPSAPSRRINEIRLLATWCPIKNSSNFNEYHSSKAFPSITSREDAKIRFPNPLSQNLRYPICWKRKSLSELTENNDFVQEKQHLPGKLTDKGRTTL